jgi:hypothetical protein
MNTQLYYTLDIIIAITLPVIMILGYRKGFVSSVVWKLFWIGCAIGSTWEFALYFNHGSENPVLLVLTPFPGDPVLHAILHTFWDGGLFIAGYFLVIAFSQSPRFLKFSWKELGIMILWGQAQEFFVEISGTYMGAWTYSDSIIWNPVLFRLADGQITIIPQVVWLIASVIFYFICRKLVH